MFVYLILFLVFAGFYFKQQQIPQKGFFFVLIFAILIAGFRDMIGGFDIYIYSDVFEHDLATFAKKNIFEPGFMAYFWVIKQINDSREWMILVSSILVLGLHSYSIRKLSPLFYISFFIYFAKFYLMSFVYIRQGLAMAVVWLAFVFFQKQKYKWMWVLAIGAVFIHKSAIIILPFLFIANRAYSLLQIFGIVVLTTFISLSPLGDFILDAAVEQIDNEKLEMYSEKSGGINFFYLIEGLLVMFLVLKYRTQMYADKNKRWILNGLLFYGIIILLSLTNATFIRFAWYYFIFVVTGLAYLLENTWNIKNRKFFKLLIFLYYTAVFLRLMVVYDGGDFMPYKSIFQDFDRNGRWEFMEYRNE